jgi:hypothetical protein
MPVPLTSPLLALSQQCTRPLEQLRDVCRVFSLLDQLTGMGDLWRGPSWLAAHFLTIFDQQHKQYISGIAAPLGCLDRSTACAARGSIA